MIAGPYLWLTVLGVLGTGLVAGVFCGFSTFVMRGLASLPPAQGVAAMNAINDALAPLGIRHFDMPATPARIWEAIRAART